MLLYIGPCTDIRPIQRYSHVHKQFVYVDGMPKSGYYPRYKTVDDILDEMIEHLEIESAYEKHEKKDGYFVIQTKGGATIQYFYDTLSQDMFKNETLDSLLQEVDTLFVQGHFPTITSDLHNLKTIIHTEACSPYYKDNRKMWSFEWNKLKLVDTVQTEFDEEANWWTALGMCENCGEYTDIYPV